MAIARRYAWSVPIIAVLGFLTSALEGLGIGLLIPLLTTMVNPDSHSGRLGISLIDRWLASFDSETRLLVITGTIFILILCKNVVAAFGQIVAAWINGNASHDMRNALVRQLLTVSYSFHIRTNRSRLTNILANESWRASDAIRALFGMAASAASLLIFALMLLIVSWPLTLAVLVGMAVIRWAHNRQLAHLKQKSIDISNVNGELWKRMEHAVSAPRATRVFGREERDMELFSNASETTRRAIFSLERASALIGPAQEVLQTMLFIVILIGGMLSVASTSVPVLVTFLVLLQRMQPHLRGFESGRANFINAYGAIQEVEWLIDPAGKPSPMPGARPFGGLRHGIRFEDVEFHYGSSTATLNPALRSITFDLVVGRATALIGPSGAGKSTVVNLLCRLIDPTAGRIVVDGCDLSEIDPAAWRSRISLAGQDIDLLDDTIAANIAYGAPHLSREEIESVAHAADAHSFISRLPQGYDSEVGSQGLSLSGGQRQRIGLARALARQPDLLILDEATNEVDGLSEASILRLLREHPGGMTILVISHRASTLACCDNGIVIADGQVTESGPLASLRAYRDMHIAVLG